MRIFSKHIWYTEILDEKLGQEFPEKLKVWFQNSYKSKC